jgi:hypothetical protein
MLRPLHCAAGRSSGKQKTLAPSPRAASAPSAPQGKVRRRSHERRRGTIFFSSPKTAACKPQVDEQLGREPLEAPGATGSPVMSPITLGDTRNSRKPGQRGGWNLSTALAIKRRALRERRHEKPARTWQGSCRRERNGCTLQYIARAGPVAPRRDPRGRKQPCSCRGCTRATHSLSRCQRSAATLGTRDIAAPSLCRPTFLWQAKNARPRVPGATGSPVLSPITLGDTRNSRKPGRRGAGWHGRERQW